MTIIETIESLTIYFLETFKPKINPITIEKIIIEPIKAIDHNELKTIISP